MRESVSQANAANDARNAAYNGGDARFYTGARPATIADGVTGTLLVTMDFGNPAFGASVNRVATANAIAGANAVADGTIGYMACFASDGTTLISTHTVGTSGSGAECIVNTLACQTGVAVSCSSFTRAQPDGA